MTKELNLNNHIDDEVLDEMFCNENNTYENMSKIDYESVDADVISESTITKNSVPKVKTEVPNEVLFQLIKDGVDVKKNREQLVLQNSGIVYKEAKSCTCRIPFDDKVQYGFMGLITSIDSFNPDLGYKFITYAGRAIRQHMYRYGNREARGIEIPEYLSTDNIRVQEYLSDFMTKNGREPTEEEIVSGTSIGIKRVKSIMRSSNNSYSFDTPVHSDNTLTLQDVISSTNPDYNLNESIKSTPLNEVLDLVFPEMRELDAELIRLVHGLDGHEPHTFDQILDLGIIDTNGNFISSKPTLSRRYNAAIEKFKAVVKYKKIYLNDI